MKKPRKTIRERKTNLKNKGKQIRARGKKIKDKSKTRIKKQGRKIKKQGRKIKKTSKKISSHSKRHIKKQGRKIKDHGRKIKKRIKEIDEEKRKQIKKYFFTLIGIVGLIYLYVGIDVRHLISLTVAKTAELGYGFVFLISFLSDLLPQPIGPDIPIISGVLGGLNIWLVILSATVASICASFIGYFLGRKFGSRGFRIFYGSKGFRKAREKYDKIGKLALLFGSITPVPYVPLCWISGTFQLKLRCFIFYGLLFRVIRFVVVGLFASSLVSLFI